MSWPLDPSLLAGFAVMGVLLALTPGPDTLFVLASAMGQGRRGAIASALGIGSGSMVHALAASLGISALIAASAPAFLALRLVGGGYLAVVGVRSLIAGARRRGQLGEAAARPVAPLGVLWRRAALTNLANPKVILFYLAVLPQFVDPGRGRIGLQLFLLGCVLNAIGTGYLVAVGLAAGRASAWLRENARLGDWLEGAAGLVFLGLGVRLLLTGRVRG